MMNKRNKSCRNCGHLIAGNNTTLGQTFKGETQIVKKNEMAEGKNTTIH